MELPARLLVLKRAGMGVNRCERVSVPRCSSDRALPSYLIGPAKWIAVPSFKLPGNGRLHSLVSRLINNDKSLGGVRLDFAKFNFQVPIELSASLATTFPIGFPFRDQFETLTSGIVGVGYGKSKRVRWWLWRA
jgi:hypothetical protein